MGISDSKENDFLIIKQIPRMFICYNLSHIKGWLENYMIDLQSLLQPRKFICLVISDLKTTMICIIIYKEFL